MSQNNEKLQEFVRVGVGLGTAHSSSNYTLSSGFGSTASVTLTDCTDSGGRVRVTVAGTGMGANPTCSITYTDVASGRAPHVFSTRGGGSQATIIMSVTSETTTGCVLTFNGTATGAETYTFNWLALS